jgi:putative transposase
VVRHRRPPSQTWRTFLDNHLGNLVSVDFFVVPTVLFKVLFVFVVLAHERRRVVHINVTDAPTAQWTAQQLVEAFPWQTAPRYLLRDRDAVYGVAFSRRAQSMGIHEVRRRLGRPGRIRTWNVSSAPSAASVSTTSWC